MHLQKETRAQEKRILELETFIKRNDSSGPVSGRELILRREKEALLQRLDVLSKEKERWAENHSEVDSLMKGSL